MAGGEEGTDHRMFRHRAAAAVLCVHYAGWSGVRVDDDMGYGFN